jgi:hypothetical protein
LTNVKLDNYITGKNYTGCLKIPNSERGREGPSGARKILKKFALPEEGISTLILFNT